MSERQALEAKIRYHCHRGMLELDLILQAFITTKLTSLTEQELSTFDTLLDEQDPDLYAWFMGFDQPDNSEYLNLIRLIQTAHQS